MDNQGRIRAHLKHRDANFFAKTVSQLIIGLLTSLVAPAIILAFFAMILHLWKLELNWWICFLAGIALSVPALFRMEWQAQGKTLDENCRSAFEAPTGASGPTDFKHLGAFGEVIAYQRTPFSGLVEFLLIGPNLAVRSYRKLKLRKLIGAGQLDRIVEITEVLSRLQGGAETEKLLAEKESRQQLSCELAYLVFFDWAGVAADGTKVWLLTEARRELSRGAK
jgi:hypothetical protein